MIIHLQPQSHSAHDSDSRDECLIFQGVSSHTWRKCTLIGSLSAGLPAMGLHSQNQILVLIPEDERRHLAFAPEGTTSPDLFIG